MLLLTGAVCKYDMMHNDFMYRYWILYNYAQSFMVTTIYNFIRLGTLVWLADGGHEGPANIMAMVRHSDQPGLVFS